MTLVAILVLFVAIPALAVAIAIALKWRLDAKELRQLCHAAEESAVRANLAMNEAKKQSAHLQTEVSRLAKWQSVADADAKARELETMGIEAKWTMAAAAREYHETIAIEKLISCDPKAREAWINRQLTLDPFTDEPDKRRMVSQEEEEPMAELTLD